MTRAIERAQKQVEGRNFEMRKHLLEYDDVMEKQRQNIYTARRDFITKPEAPREFIDRSVDEIVEWLVAEHCPVDQDPLDWPLDALKAHLLDFFGLAEEQTSADFEKDGPAEILEALRADLKAAYAAKIERLGESAPEFQKWICLQILDSKWKDHLYALDRLKEGIGLRGYGQRNPLVEYKRESFDMFTEMNDRMQAEIVRYAYRMEPMTREQQEAQLAQRRAAAARAQETARAATRTETAKPQPVVKPDESVGRNDPCPCGSGKKYKKCHGF